MAFAPGPNLVMAANNANSPAFATLVNATLSPSAAFGNITVPNQPTSGGMEQSVWDPSTKTFFVSIPTLTSNSNDAGGIAEVDPTTGKVINTFGLAGLGGITSCSRPVSPWAAAATLWSVAAMPAPRPWW
jgi:hypothetical protein